MTGCLHPEQAFDRSPTLFYSDPNLSHSRGRNMIMPYGYTGKILHVDLSNQKIEIEKKTRPSIGHIWADVELAIII